jgi:hypothetical protein
MTDDRTSSYIERVAQRLTGEGYRLNPSSDYLISAEKSGFQLTKMGNVDTSVRVGRLAERTPAALEAFSSYAFADARAVKRGFRMPASLFQAYFCLAVAVVDSAPPELAAFVAGYTPPKHWSAFESVALYDLGAGQLHVFTGTPLWGAAYYAGTRKQLQRLFG